MTSQHSPTASPVDVLYETDTYQVRLFALPPSAHWEAALLPPAISAQLILVGGTLTAQCPPEGLPKTLSTGQRILLTSNQPIHLKNSNQTPALLVEIRWANSQSSMPLPEVTEERPWGSFTVLKDEPHYKLKQLAVNVGNRLSLQRHQKREEHWFVTAGHPAVTLEDAVIELAPGDYIHIPQHHWHRITNPAENTSPVEIIELQLGDYFGEDDIERRQDDYGRS